MHTVCPKQRKGDFFFLQNSDDIWINQWIFKVFEDKSFNKSEENMFQMETFDSDLALL